MKRLITLCAAILTLSALPAAAQYTGLGAGRSKPL